ncbi:MAG TPA: RT0821/Lpp0805 family surface protein [Alphaproteobacteria bacterium]|nr:RT0821/Lpp0805 family surface protein [Alphaproteobacteria bacterium]
MNGKKLCTTLASALVLAALSATAVAEPPPWAPAHGYRAKQRGPEMVVIERPVFYSLPVGIDHGGCDYGLISNQIAGGLLGGAVGGLAGSQIGGGSGQTLATIGGVLVGALVGSSIGQSMDAVDQACVAQALERADAGQPVAWVNPDNGGRYRVVPDHSYEHGGRQCREYTASAEIGGARDTITGVACRLPDGTWEKIR